MLPGQPIYKPCMADKIIISNQWIHTYQQIQILNQKYTWIFIDLTRFDEGINFYQFDINLY